MTAVFRDDFFAFARTIGPEARLRLAPTPSGYLHAGNGFNFILNAVCANLHPQARLLLRIDDLDADRKRPEYVQDVFETLQWLGIHWDEGPVDIEDFDKNWSQYQRMALYEAILARLRAAGLVFGCKKSRKELALYERYPAAFRDQGIPDLDTPDTAWRLRSTDEVTLGDFVVRRRDGIPAYQVATVADDVYFGITHIIRGSDLRESTLAQQFLAECTGYRDFTCIRFLHHPLLTGPDGKKLSKSEGATALRALRAEHNKPVLLYRQVAEWLGVAPADDLTSLADRIRQQLAND